MITHLIFTYLYVYAYSKNARVWGKNARSEIMLVISEKIIVWNKV